MSTYCYVFTFYKRFNKKLKYKIFIVRTTLSDCSHLTDTTIIVTIIACTTQLFAILLTNATILFELHTQLVTKLLELQLAVVCSVLPFYSPKRWNKRTFLIYKILMLAFSISLLRPLVYVHSHICEHKNLIFQECSSHLFGL